MSNKLLSFVFILTLTQKWCSQDYLDRLYYSIHWLLTDKVGLFGCLNIHGFVPLWVAFVFYTQVNLTTRPSSD